MEEKQKKAVNSGHYQFLGTDKNVDGEKSFGKEYFEYRKKWKENPEKQIVGDFPLHLDIESTNSCNLMCVMCGRNFMKEKQGFMDQKLYKKIIDEASKYHLPSIKLNYRGEPLLHPQISEMVKYAKEKGVIEVQFNSNGLLLTEEKAKELISSGLDRIIFSFDAGKKETYEKIRKGSNFDIVVKNINNFVKIRNEMGKTMPLVRVQMVKMPENKGEVEEFINMWLPVANRVSVSTYRNPLGTNEKMEHFPCHQIWQRLMICFDGEVRMCCGDWYGEIKLGDANKTSLYDIWHGEKLNEIRKIHSQKKFQDISLCAKCEVNTYRFDEELDGLIKEYNK